MGLTRFLFPLGGVDRSGSFAASKPYRTPLALNVQPTAGSDGRDRGGVRPGLVRQFNVPAEQGKPWQNLFITSQQATDAVRMFSDDFEEGVGADWELATGVSGTPGLPDRVNKLSGLPEEAENHTLAYLKDLSVDTAKPYQIDLDIAPWFGAYYGSFYIVGDMENVNPLDHETDGIMWELALDGFSGRFASHFRHAKTGETTSVYRAAGATGGLARAGRMTMYVTGANIFCYWMGRQIFAIARSFTQSAPTTGRVGFGMRCIRPGGACLADRFTLRYSQSDAEILRTNRKLLVGIGGGSLYAEDEFGNLRQKTGATYGSNESVDQFSDTASIQMADRINTVYIADYGVILEGDGSLTSGALAKDTGNFTNDEIVSDIHAVELIDAGASTGVYQIDTKGSTITLAGTSATVAEVKYRVHRQPKQYSIVTGNVTPWVASASKGSVPLGCPLVARYRDRLVVAGFPPNQWYMSRQGDPLDWDYLSDPGDVARAVAAQNAEAGALGEPITCLAPVSDDYLIFGCKRSLWLLRGDPLDGGRLDDISTEIGVVGANAWTRGEDGRFIFLSHDGLYQIAVGSTASPKQMSKFQIPRELMDLDGSEWHITLQYDRANQGVWIFKVPKSDPATASTKTRQTESWWFDEEYRGFWPMQFPASKQPACAAMYSTDQATQQRVIIGCLVGGIRMFDVDAKTDDGSAIDSKVLFGPIALGQADDEGVLITLHPVLGNRSGAAVIKAKGSDTYENASLDQEWEFEESLEAGTNDGMRPRVRGYAMSLLVESSTTGEAWEFESMVGERRRRGGGRRR